MNVHSNYRHLSRGERILLCEFIRPFVGVARDLDHPMRKVARGQISSLLWRWTADAYCQRRNLIKADAIKYDVTMLPSTEAARSQRLISIKGLRHEHSVPRIMMADRIIDADLDVEGIFKLLDRCCKAVILTREEDGLLSKLMRQSMPAGWDWETGCPFARYTAAGMYDSIDWGS